MDVHQFRLLLTRIDQSPGGWTVPSANLGKEKDRQSRGLTADVPPPRRAEHVGAEEFCQVVYTINTIIRDKRVAIPAYVAGKSSQA